jgi:folate-dependent tRNA-U54 methylase TrmFO/GidA
MRLATFRLQRSEGDTEDVEVSVIPAMGSEAANIDRWRSQQFKENPVPATTTREVPGMKLTVTEMEGTFVTASGPRPGTKLWGAIVRLSGADNLIFFKAWGPKASMEKWKASFDELAASLKPVAK